VSHLLLVCTLQPPIHEALSDTRSLGIPGGFHRCIHNNWSRRIHVSRKSIEPYWLPGSRRCMTVRRAVPPAPMPALVRSKCRGSGIASGCADVCVTTGQILWRQTEPAWDLVRSQLQACVTACHVCGEECERHADHHEHCRACADACRRCEEACNLVLNALPA
jgi:hypothetical protein